MKKKLCFFISCNLLLLSMSSQLRVMEADPLFGSALEIPKAKGNQGY